MQYIRERRDGLRIRVDGDRLERTGLTAELFDEAWQRASAEQLQAPELRVTVDLGRLVGRAAVVKAPEIGPTDKTLFARRPGYPASPALARRGYDRTLAADLAGDDHRPCG